MLAFFGPVTRTTLVSQPVAGEGGVIAFRHHVVAAVMRFTIDNGLITKIHAVADPRLMTRPENASNA